MSLIENYGQAWLEESQFPDHHQNHRCGDAPFVPNVDGPRQHSCGSYKDGFGPNGCNKYRPNYPDDLYLKTHGCKGLADCKNGIPPTGDIIKEGSPHFTTERPVTRWWPADGYAVPDKVGPACKEGFLGGLVKNDTIANLLWAGVFWIIVKYAMKRK